MREEREETNPLREVSGQRRVDGLFHEASGKRKVLGYLGHLLWTTLLLTRECLMARCQRPIMRQTLASVIGLASISCEVSTE